MKHLYSIDVLLLLLGLLHPMIASTTASSYPQPGL